MNVFLSAVLGAATSLGALGWLSGRLDDRTAARLLTIGLSLSFLLSFESERYLLALVDAGLASYFTHLWWNTGGRESAWTYMASLASAVEDLRRGRSEGDV
ncbi:hypothetical protein ACFYNF_33880 [Streptomyces sp. NPDC006641]|uniref:hypothetical protein n=1 Tax=unclassified Streptomyces TaxID=2593676 RepID=UPI00344A4F0C